MAVSGNSPEGDGLAEVPKTGKDKEQGAGDDDNKELVAHTFIQ